MAIAAPQSSSSAHFGYLYGKAYEPTRVVPPAEVWEPNRRQARAYRGALGVEHTATAIRTLSPHPVGIERDREASGIDLVVRNHGFETITLVGSHRDHAAARNHPMVPVKAKSSGSAQRSERWANAFAGSLVGLVLAAGIALFAQPGDTQPPVPDGVTPDFTISQSAHR